MTSSFNLLAIFKHLGHLDCSFFLCSLPWGICQVFQIDSKKTCAKTNESNSESIFWRLVSSKFGAILWLAFLKMRDLETCINMGFLKETQLFYDVQCNFQNHSWTQSLARGLALLAWQAGHASAWQISQEMWVEACWSLKKHSIIIKSSIWWCLKMAPKTHRFQYYGLMILMMLMTWINWGYPHDLGKPHLLNLHWIHLTHQPMRARRVWSWFLEPRLSPLKENPIEIRGFNKNQGLAGRMSLL